MLKTLDIEVAVTKWFGIRKHVITTNISWGLGLHECDLLIMSKSRYLTEVEIKISLADLKKDLQKQHKHKSNKIKYLYFAIPSYLAKHIEYIPAHAGILVVNSKKKVFEICKPKMNTQAQALTEKEKIKLLELAVMRIWKLKEKLGKLQNNA